MGLQGSRVQIPPSRWGAVLRGGPSSFSGAGSVKLGMRRLLLVAPILLAACSPGQNASFQGCKTMSSTADIPVNATVDTTKLLRTASGLGIEELRTGTGVTAQAGNVVAVHYTGWLTDGTEFDSSRRRGQVYVFPLGRQQVIAGWDE